MATEQILDGQYFRRLKDATNNVWERLSFWTKAKDVYFEDGSNLESKTLSGGNSNSIYSVDVKGFWSSSSPDLTTCFGSQGLLRIISTPINIDNYFAQDSRWANVQDKADLGQFFSQRWFIPLDSSLKEQEGLKLCNIDIYLYFIGSGVGTVNNNSTFSMSLDKWKNGNNTDTYEKWAHKYALPFTGGVELLSHGSLGTLRNIFAGFDLWHDSVSSMAIRITNNTGSTLDLTSLGSNIFYARMQTIGYVAKLATPA